MTTEPSLGEQLDAITKRMDAAYAAWKAAGHPAPSPERDAIDDCYADLREWTARVQQR